MVFTLLASMVPIAPAVQIPSRPPNATAGARQAKNRKKVEDITWTVRRGSGASKGERKRGRVGTLESARANLVRTVKEITAYTQKVSSYKRATTTLNIVRKYRT